MTKASRTAIAVVLDRSGSMESIHESTMKGYNDFLAEQKAEGGDATLTLVQFDDHYEVHHDDTPIANVPPLNDMTYVPRGTTALLDAVGLTIDSLGARLAAMPEHERPARVIVAIITDGMENASREFSRERVFSMITHQREKYSWDFLFLGANQDAIASGASIGIHTAYSASFRSNDQSARLAFRRMSSKVSESRRSPGGMSAFSEFEREQLLSDQPADSAPKSPRVRRPRKRRSSSGSSA